MQKKADLYICKATQSERFRFIQIFEKNFSYEVGKLYFGYLGINVDRVKMISVITDFRIHKIACFGVPIEYRDQKNISESHAFDIAEKYAAKINALAFKRPLAQSESPPVYWKFGLNEKDTIEEKAGGIVMIDRLDGHVWTAAENEEYMYDYNNIF